MTQQADPEVVLYDLACTKNVCFSPIVWRIRLMLNYKNIAYRTVFLEFPDIEPTLKGFGIVLPETASNSQIKYTVPAIYHVPSNQYIMDSAAISEFLEATYPEPAVQLKSDLGTEIETKSRAAIRRPFYTSIMPREINILSPPAQEYFRRTREAAIGHKLEDLIDSVKEEKCWNDLHDQVHALGELMQTHKAKGPFILGAFPSYVDFFIAASLQSARVVDEGIFERMIKFPGFREVYEACLPYMERND